MNEWITSFLATDPDEGGRRLQKREEARRWIGERDQIWIADRDEMGWIGDRDGKGWDGIR